MTRAALKAFIFIVSLAFAISAQAQDAAASTQPGPLYQRGGLLGTGLVIGAKVGGGFSQPFGELGSSFITELEVGYILPALDHSFELLVAGAYTQPKAEGKVSDARLPGAASYTLTQQQAMLTLALLYRLPLPSDLIRPYAAVGPRLFAMRSKVNGDAAGESFGKNEETVTKAGVWAALGIELHLGPGAVLIEASVDYAKIDGYVLRDTNTGALGAALGYRFFL